ncbi:MAG TPA: DNA polymerase/3'-5' exonuclease PolX [Dehalococcoidia bacterium]|nr:DNA polymerase/3'-5' exonuclease PolX [Dehalococcoidia bacterium]
MNNVAIAEVMESIAQLLELKGESSFKVRAYRRAAQAIENLPAEVERLMREGRLREIPGVGDSISQKIIELLGSGKCEYYENLRAEFPSGITRLMEIPGIGPKTASRLAKDLSIATVEDLEQAVLDGRVAKLPRMGEKLAENILHHLRSLRRKDQRIPLGQALPVADAIVEQLKDNPALRNLTPAGSLRRRMETIGDIDIIGTSDAPKAVMDQFTGLAQVKEVLVKGPTKTSVVVEGGVQVDLRLVEHDAFGSLLQHFTGSKQHNIDLRELALKKGLSLSEYGITRLLDGQLQKFTEEEAFYAALGLEFIPPELREASGEIEAAGRQAIPRLVEQGDIRGDLHTHTDWSDGRSSLREMVEAARDLGYEYVAVTDHSVGRGVARGLSVERLLRQREEIQELDRSVKGITVLQGAEVDIRADGTLDFPDEVLAGLDVVTASVHSSMGQDEETMTNRILKVIQNPHVDIIGHLTCRLLGHRPPVALNIEKVLRAAAETKTALEINSQPERLDLKDVHIRQARDLGVMMVINTDAHWVHQLSAMRFGVATARRGWCEPRHILNTRTLPEVLAYLRERSLS